MQKNSTFATVPELAILLLIPAWRVRELVDSLPLGSVERAGRVRVVHLSLLPLLRAEVAKRGWVESAEPESAVV